MKKNLIVFHLESLSNDILNQEADHLTFIKKLMDESLIFKNFYTSATSSILAFTDFCYGNDFELDNSYDVDNDLNIVRREKNLFKILEDNNYNVKGIAYPKTWRDDLNNKDIWNLQDNIYKYHDKEEYFKQEIFDIIDEHDGERPFALHVWDIRSHLFYSDPKKEQGQNFLERRSLGYGCIDETYNEIYSLIKKKGLLENTVLVAYGDHGDELWSHSLNGGFCHAIEPYSNIIRTPCFIQSPGLERGSVDSLVSLTDLKWTILELLNIESESRFTYSGKNILQEENEVVFSRNFLANQYSKYSGALRKGYSASNKNYHLMVSDLGLELYAQKIDPANTFNLLLYFNLQDRELTDFNKRGAWHTHFNMIMKKDQIEDIKENFRFLYNHLYDYVETKNSIIDREKTNYFEMQAFRRIKPKVYDWNA